MRLKPEVEQDSRNRRRIMLDGFIFTAYGAVAGGVVTAFGTGKSGIDSLSPEKLFEGIGTGIVIAGATAAIIIFKERKELQRQE